MAADLAAARLAGAAGRLMAEVRLGLVALRRCRPAGTEEEEGIWLARARASLTPQAP